MRIKVIKEHSFIEDLLENKEITVVDLGACRGEFIDEMNEFYNIKKAILVEANPTNFKNLTNKPNYVLYNNVISSISGETVLFYEDTKSPYNGSKVFNYFDGVEHRIKSIKLEEIMIENNISYIDLLKIDIEGSEYDVMLNISDDCYSKIKQITVEFHDFVDNNLKEATENVIKKLESLGFSRISKGIKYMNNSDNYDVLFYK
jgi:FkbM family methyltransferase